MLSKDWFIASALLLTQAFPHCHGQGVNENVSYAWDVYKNVCYACNGKEYNRSAHLYKPHVFCNRCLRNEHVPFSSHICDAQFSQPRLEKLCDGSFAVHLKKCLPLALSAEGRQFCAEGRQFCAEGRQFLKAVLDNGKAEKRIPTEMEMCVEACSDARMLEVDLELLSARHKLSDVPIDEETQACLCKQTESFRNKEDCHYLKKCLLICVFFVILIMAEKASRMGSFIDANIPYEIISDIKYQEKPFIMGKPADGQKSSWRFIFEFSHSWKIKLTVCPFTLNQYVNEVVNDHREPTELMKYEWSRYMSFQSFPQDSRVTPMRLAQAGFFWTGHGEKVKCFCCGVTNDVWSDEESVWHAHQRLSPSCRFIRGESNDNVPIHGPEYYESSMS